MSDEIPEPQENTFEEMANDTNVPADASEFQCTLCGYQPRASCTNPKEALRKHMQRYHKHSSTETAVDAIVNDVLESASKEQECQKLLEDIEILQVKFPDLGYEPNVHPDSSFEKLQRTKNTLVRLISDRSGADAAFHVMLVGCRGAEMLCRVTHVGDIEGFATDVADMKQDFTNVLKEMIDTGVIESTQLSPEVRLGFLLCTAAMGRFESNRGKNLADASDSPPSSSPPPPSS